MYLPHFDLSQKPFSLIPDPDFLHFSKKHRAAYSMLEYGIYEQTGITVVTGEVGSGKTTLIRHLLNQINHNQLSVGLISNTHESLGDLTYWIAMAFGIEHKGRDKTTLYRDIQDYFITRYASGRNVVLIVDEAQNMNAQALEELRLFTNINTQKDNLLHIMLVGQPELSTKLQQPNLFQIAQRVSVEYHLNPLNWEETCAYIRHRLATAGGAEDIFDNNALGVIFYHTGGIPRLINTLCDYALVHAYAMDKVKVDLDIAMEVVSGRKISGINRFIKLKEEVEAVRRTLRETTGRDIAIVG